MEPLTRKAILENARNVMRSLQEARVGPDPDSRRKMSGLEGLLISPNAVSRSFRLSTGFASASRVRAACRLRRFRSSRSAGMPY